MTTEDIADILEVTAKLMELHEENPFKIKSYANAAFKLSKTRIDLKGLDIKEIEQIEGIGKSISAKIMTLLTTGELEDLRALKEKTPEGVIELLGVKGLGPKKVRQLWKELQIESIGELLYACNENRLIDLKGFGTKTQESVKQAIEFKLQHKNLRHYATVESFAFQLLVDLKQKYPNKLIALTGDIYRKCEVLEKIDILLEEGVDIDTTWTEKINFPINYITVPAHEFYYKLVETSATPEHLKGIRFSDLKTTSFSNEADVYQELQIQYVEPELREGLFELEKAKQKTLPDLITTAHLKGILHNHTTYSDGVHTLEEMSLYCKELGYEYLGICDHSKSAGYAGGLKEERIIEQHHEIDKLNRQLAPFKIFKGIESDILGDGSLDYSPDVLSTFDFVVASIHQNLKMDETKATERLIKAIENPYTTILGHPTGRLLLARPGYPINHKKVIDACAANKVVIELNAHPYRLDIDWRWIPYCLEKGVLISINPDAHQKKGFHDMYYGTCVARKGLLTPDYCFNALSLVDIEQYFKNKQP